VRAPSAIDHAKTPDLELAELAGMGDPDAFPALFDRHFPGLYDLAARTVGDSEAAAKVVEDTFSRAWDLIASGRRVPDLRAWLYTVAHKGAVSRARARGRGRSQGSGASAAEAALLDLHTRRGLSAEELAAALGAPPFTVRARLARARRHLQDGGDGAAAGAAIEAPPEVSDAVRAHVARTALTPGSWAGDPARASRAPAREQLVALGSAALALVARVVRRAQGAGPAMAAATRGGHERWGRLASAKGIVLAAALATAGVAAAAVTLGGGGARPARPGDVHSTSHSAGVASTQTAIVAPRPVPKPASATATIPSTTGATAPPPPVPAKRKPTRHAVRPVRPRRYHRPPARRRASPPAVARPPAAPTPQPTTSQPTTTLPPTTTQPPPGGTQGGTPAAPG